MWDIVSFLKFSVIEKLNFFVIVVLILRSLLVFLVKADLLLPY